MLLDRAVVGWEQTAIEQLLALPAMHVDETSLRVDRKNHWIHVCSAGEITLKFVHPKRGREAIEANGYAWAGNMKHLLQETCTRVSKRKRKKLTEGEYKRLQNRYRTILTRGEQELPPIPPRQNG